MLATEMPPPEIAQTETAAVGNPGLLGTFLKSIPLPRGPQWYLIIYRWLLVGASVYTVVITWNAWQDRSDPNWHAWPMATPVNQATWNHRPTDHELAPMLPAWDWLPEFDVGPILVGSLLLILIRPRLGLALSAIVMVMAVLMDRSRLHPHYVLWFMMLATLPSAVQLVGRANLISLWLWAGFHKLILDFIKPPDFPGFTTDVIPGDLIKLFPPDQFSWSTHSVGVVLGYVIGASEMSLALMCLWRPTRKIAAVFALFLHAGILWWNCRAPHCNLLGWNISLALSGLFLILPWRDTFRESWTKCGPKASLLALFLLAYPATYYINGASGYLSYCVYVPITPSGDLHRPGEDHHSIMFMPYDVINFPLPPGHSIEEAYFDKIRRPTDELLITDPRPWAQHHGMGNRRLTADGELRDNQPYGHWVHRNSEGKLLSEGDILDGKESGHWTFWYPDGKKAMEGEFVDGRSEGVWKMWTPEGEETDLQYHDGDIVEPAETAPTKPQP